MTNKDASVIIGNIPIEGDDCYTIAEYQEAKARAIKALEQQPTGHCKDCRWWKDSDGAYRRGVEAESICPINREEILKGEGYCFLYEPKMQEVEEDES